MQTLEEIKTEIAEDSIKRAIFWFKYDLRLGNIKECDENLRYKELTKSLDQKQV